MPIQARSPTPIPAKKHTGSPREKPATLNGADMGFADVVRPVEMGWGTADGQAAAKVRTGKPFSDSPGTLILKYPKARVGQLSWPHSRGAAFRGVEWWDFGGLKNSRKPKPNKSGLSEYPNFHRSRQKYRSQDKKSPLYLVDIRGFILVAGGGFEPPT